MCVTPQNKYAQIRIWLTWFHFCIPDLCSRCKFIIPQHNFSIQKCLEMSIHHHATQVFVAFFRWKTIGKSLVLRRNRILCRFCEAVPQHPGTNSQTVCHLRHPSPKNATESPVQVFFHQKIVPWIWKLLFSGCGSCCFRKNPCCCFRLFVS